MSIVSVSSSSRSSGDVNSFVLNLTDPLRDVKIIKSMFITVPYTWYTIMAGINDKIYITVAGPTTYTATLTQGNYTKVTIVVEFQTQFNAAYVPDNNFTCTLTALTDKLTINHTTTAYTLSFATNTTASARKLIGLTEADHASTTGIGTNEYVIGDMLLDITGGYRNLFVRSIGIGRSNSYKDSQRSSYILVVPIEGNQGDIITFQAQGDNWAICYPDQQGRSFQELDFALFFDDGNKVPLNNMDWRMSFRYYSLNKVPK